MFSPPLCNTVSGTCCVLSSSDKECQEWIDVINFSAAIYSSPSLPSANECKKFQRPLMPSTYTKLKLVSQQALW